MGAVDDFAGWHFVAAVGGHFMSSSAWCWSSAAAEKGFVGKFDFAAVVDAEDFDFDFVALFDDVFDAVDAVVGEFGDMN